MKIEKVTINQIFAGALLKFGCLDSVDMTLLIGDLGSKYEIIHDKCDIGDSYFLLCNGNILLNEECLMRYWGSVDSKILEKIQGNIVKEYMDNLDVFMFTLRKIRLFGLGCVVKETLFESFSSKELKCIDELYQKSLIEDYVQEDSRYGNYVAVRLTQEGKLQLFKIDNKNVIENFLKIVRYNGYSDMLVDQFLLEQDLDGNCYEILNLINYNDFCLNRCENPKSYNYSRTSNINKR